MHTISFIVINHAEGQWSIVNTYNEEDNKCKFPVSLQEKQEKNYC